MQDGPRSRVAIRAEGVTLAYDGDPAVADASFEIAVGCVAAVVGPNGSGKTTLLHGLAGILAPVRGRLEVLGGSPGRVRSAVAYVLQATRANERIPVTVREVVAMGRYAERGAFGRLGPRDRELVDQAMERLEIADLARRHISELSGGQRQRVFVAQGLAQDAELLLLDEPVTGLDIPSQRQILEAVRSERDRGRTIVMTTHDLGEASRADVVLLLARRLVAAGPPREVLTGPHLADAYGGRLVTLPDGRSALDEGVHHDHPH